MCDPPQGDRLSYPLLHHFRGRNPPRALPSIRSVCQGIGERAKNHQPTYFDGQRTASAPYLS
jgi:hypothetical protein